MSGFSDERIRMAWALRQTFLRGYGMGDLRADVMAGIVVGSVALPLSLALAIATGVPPQYGLYTAIVAGIVTGLMGGSPVQISGPTAAFVVILTPIVHKFGMGGLLIATFMAGIFLALMGIFRMGQVIAFIPNPVTIGFTAGIAVVIGTLQLKDLFGLDVAVMPEHFIERASAIARALPTFRAEEFAIGLGTIVILQHWHRVSRKVPSALVALALMTTMTYVLSAIFPDFHPATINSRFNGIPQALPHLAFPWSFPGPDGAPLVFSMDLIRALLPSAAVIAVLCAIESLLSAVVADAVTGGTHDPDAELIAQGFGNILAPFVGGFATTGALARTSTNIRAGAKSPIASVIHSLFLLASIVFVAPILGHLPMAALAGLLLVVAYNMSEWRHFLHVMRVAPRSDIFVLLTCFVLTVAIGMVVSVTVGVLLASILFMRRMAEVSGAKLIGDEHPIKANLPKGVVVYQIGGPLFFGAAQKAMSVIRAISEDDDVHTMILDLTTVPAIDATGLVNLESTLKALSSANIFVVLGGIQEQPLRALRKAGIVNHPDRLAMTDDFDDALQLALERF